MLQEYTIDQSGNIVIYDKVQVAIERIKFAYEISSRLGLGDLYVAFSGGKDSVVLAELVRMSGVPYTLNYNVTGIDPPEVVYFMREHYPGLIRNMYSKSMWQLIVERKSPPTRLIRFCCSELKEHGGEDKMCLLGVRWAESVKRQKRRAYEVVHKNRTEKMLFNDNDEDRLLFEHCANKGKRTCNPIIDWSDDEVWEFIKRENLPYCKLYDEGKTRIGCIGCPQGNTRGMLRDFERYPKFKVLYVAAFQKMLDGMPNCTTWKSGEDVFNWWVYTKKHKSPEQLDIDDLLK